MVAKGKDETGFQVNGEATEQMGNGVDRRMEKRKKLTCATERKKSVDEYR